MKFLTFVRGLYHAIYRTNDVKYVKLCYSFAECMDFWKEMEERHGQTK